MKTGQQTPFDDLILETKDGEWGEGEEAHGHTLCEIVRGTDFADLHDANLELPRRWIPDHLVERKALRPGDILIETAGGTAKQSTGRTAYLTESFFSRHREMPVLCSSFARHLRVDATKVRPDYLYYVLQALYRAGYMAVFNLQHTGVARFQFTAFRRKTSLELASREAQPKIAAILSAYDDLIANSQRRIALLEGIAEDIYREWFTRFRFPGKSTADMEAGLPRGWQAKRVRDVVERLAFGRVYHESDVSAAGNVVVIDQSRADFLGFHDGEPQHCASRETPTILFGDHSCKMLVMTKPFSLAENVVPFVPKDSLPPYFLYHQLKDMVRTTEYKRHWTELMTRIVLRPPIHLSQHFDHLVQPIHEQVEGLRQMAWKARSTQMSLLPRLISGKLKVDHLDIRLPPSMRAEAEAVA